MSTQMLSSLLCLTQRSLVVALAIGAFLLAAAPDLAATGALDLSFGSGGSVSTPIGSGYANAVAIQPDGKIITAGISYGDIALIRYNTDGSLDQSFGTGGKVITAASTGADVANAIVVLADGKVLVAGNVRVNTYENHFAVLKYNSNGSLDTSFGTGGLAMADVGDFYDIAQSLAIQADGKIVAAGYLGVWWDFDTNIALVRFNADGSLDTSFGSGGIIGDRVAIDNDPANAVVIQADGKIVAGGYRGGGFGLTRYNTNGTLDASFGDGGKLFTLFDGGGMSQAYSVAVQHDGKIVAAGNSYTGTYPVFQNYSAVARYLPDGSPDAGFGSGGKIRIPSAGSSNSPRGLALQSNGKIVLAGYDLIDNRGAFSLTRLNTDGSLDANFGAGGRVITPLNASGSAAYALAIQPNGRIVASGVGYDGNEPNFAVARYLAEPAKRTPYDFDGDGRSDVAVFRPSDARWYLNRSTSGFTSAQFGVNTDTMVPSDFDGDGKTDIAVFRSGSWYWLSSLDGGFNSYQFGTAADVAVPSDFTGDGRAELVVYRNGVWWMHDLATGEDSNLQFGLNTDIPIAADFDGDGRADQAVNRHGAWFINQSTAGFTSVQFGSGSDKLVPADYDGDGKTDVAVYRTGTWYILGSQVGFKAFQFGTPTDIPVPGDYDGDGTTDVAVFRPAEGNWYQQKSTAGFSAVHFGANGDLPVGGPVYDPLCHGCWDYRPPVSNPGKHR